MSDFADYVLALVRAQLKRHPAFAGVKRDDKVRGGGAGPDGALRRSKDGKSEGLDLELTVTDGEYVKRKLWVLLTLQGETEGHAEAGRIAGTVLRAIVESARNIAPGDQSEAAKQQRKLNSYLDLDGMRFIGRIGVEPAKNGYDAKNKLASVITPDMQAWRKPDQGVASAPAVKPSKPQSGGGAVVSRPKWSR
jgi:hypothetical protein